MEKLIKNKNDIHHLSLLLVIISVFALFNVITFFSDTVVDFLEASSAIPFIQLICNTILLCMSLLLLHVYRRWLKTKKNQHELEQMMANINPDVRMVVDPENKIIMCDRSVERMFGYKQEEIVNQNINMIIPDTDTKQKPKYKFYDEADGGTLYLGIEAEGKTSSGETISLEISMGKIRSSHNSIYLLHDISKRKRAEAEVQRLNKEMDSRVEERTADLQKAYTELKGVDKLRDALLSSVSQELSRPLTSIRASAETILNGTDAMTYMQRELIGMILNESEGLVQFVNEVLDQEIYEVKNNWFPKKLDAMDIIKRCVDAKASELWEQSLNLEMNISKNIPKFIADEDRIHQVLMNLLSNSIKFTPPGGDIKISANLVDKKRAEDKSDYIHFSISDTGIGIPEKNISLYFNRFKNDDQKSTSSHRSGQGLSICNDIITYHGGKLWAKSAVGKGSTFHFTLPIKSPLQILQQGTRLESWKPPKAIYN